METKRIAINGFGRIGRAFFRMVHEMPELEVVAINDLGSVESLAYLLQYDSVYKKADFSVSYEGQEYLIIDGKKIKMTHEKNPEDLPWASLNIDCVLESTGLFTQYDKAYAHIVAGAKHVVISAPGKEDPEGSVKGEMMLAGINLGPSESKITSNASCTTNATSPLIAILSETVGIESALLSTTHAYTATQAIIDGPSKKDLREGRAAAVNIVPSSTGAAKAMLSIYPELSGKFDGISLRVPVPSGSIVDLTFVSKRETSQKEILELLENASLSDKYKGLIRVSRDPLVSSDIIGDTTPCIVDAEMLRVVNGNLIKILAWYDNEYGYTQTLVRHILAV